MNMKEKEMESKLRSRTKWQETTDEAICSLFRGLGFHCPEDFMEVRVYDFLNLDRVDNNRAEEMIVALTELLYPDKEKYSDRFDSVRIEPVMLWLIEHPNPSTVTLRDLICAEKLSLEEILDAFDAVSMGFYHSPEYNSRKYRYGHRREIESV